jgi:hypothetical protein
MFDLKFMVVLLFLCSISSAEISIGADITTYSYTSNTESELSTGTKYKGHSNRSAFLIGPMIGIFPSKSVEIAPFFKWGITKSSNEVTTEGNLGSTQESENSQHSIEPGCGAYFHVIKNNAILDFSLGPKLSYLWSFKPFSKGTTTNSEYEKYYNGSLNLGLQTNIDLKFTEHFKTRFYSNLLRISLQNVNTKTYGQTTEDRDTDFSIDFKTILQPSFGFHFTF